MLPKKLALFKTHLSACDNDEAFAVIAKMAAEKENAQVSALAVHGLMIAARDEHYRKVLNQFDLVLADGQPIRISLNIFFEQNLKERVYGPHLMLRLCEKAALENWGIYLYGNTDAVLAKLQAELLRKFPSITDLTLRPSIFRELTDSEVHDLAFDIRNSNARLVFIGIGCPEQEKLVARLAPHTTGVLIAVGAAFDFLSGEKKMAPLWMQSASLEWLFRLIQEPRRLGRRYLVTNSFFIFEFTKLFITKKLGRLK